MVFKKQWLLIPLPMLLLYVFNAGLTYVWNSYITYPWIDIPMHFLGGAAVAWTFIHGMRAVEDITHKKYAITVVHTLLFVLVIGVVWEVYEYIHDFYSTIQFFGGVRDTIGDIILDLLGGFTAALLLDKKK